jgi:pyruvate dehydrogenase E2 component (dihydrolipoyllysine-residue acetyltransferase)
LDGMTSSSNEPYVVVMPRLGLSMTEGTIVAWNKREGEWVQKGEELFTFESDKSAIVIEAPASGPVHILVEAGETVDVQTPVAVIGEASKVPKGAQAGGAGQPSQPSAVGEFSARPERRVGPAASPRARAQAKSRGIPLDGLRGSGIRGMIVVSDLKAVEERPQIRATPVARRLAADEGIDLSHVQGTGPHRRVVREDVEHAISSNSVPFPGLTGLRAIIADRLSTGWRERPQVTLNTVADAVELVSTRARLSQTLGSNVPYEVLFIRASAIALTEFRFMNAALTRSGVVEFDQVNVGVAVDTERGLMVPVLHQADQLGLSEMCQVFSERSSRALAGESLPDEMKGGTFTITNLGMFGVDWFTPIINPPEIAILGIGRIVSQPTNWEGQLALREQVSLSLSFDHRLVDGAPAARFLARIKDLVEHPSSLFDAP